MTYIKSIPISVYKNWKSYQDYKQQVVYPSFHPYLRENYAEYIISVEFTNKLQQTVNMDRLITFRSRAHYTWFLLQQ